MKQGVRRAVLAFVVVAATMGVLAAGTLVEEQGARASAQGGAFAARADDPSAIFYNPAGLAFQGTAFMAGFSFINEHMKYEGSTGTVNGPVKTYYPLYLYLNYKINDNVAFGFGMNSPFDLATEWPAGWPGAAISERTLQRAIYYTPTLAFKVSKNWAVSISANYVDSTLYLRQEIPFPAIPYPKPPLTRIPPSGMGVIRGGGDAWGWGVGVLGKLDDHWQIGINYRSKVNIGYTGDVSFYNIPNYNPDFTPLFPYSHVSSTICLPAVYTLGVAYKTDKWTLEFDATAQQWDVMKSIAINFDPNGGQVQDKSVPQNWKNTGKYKLGFEYKLSDKWSYGLGYFYDEAPVPDQYASPILPDSNRNGFTGGLSYKKGHWSMDAYLMYLPFQDKNVPSTTPFVPGTYKAYAYLGGAALTYKF